MRLTSLADYAVVMLAAAARHPAGARLSAAVLAAETGVPLPTAQKLMGRLASAGLLSSARGTGGGFVLARGADGISLADIIEAVEGPIAMTTCVDETRHDCALEGACNVRPHMSVVNGAVREALQSISLARLARTAVRPEPVEGLSFTSSPSSAPQHVVGAREPVQ
ncbi:MAG TPA: SUF system Fe-S cluster assembly regulator [Allosphingosinicella sp.]|nr:SUF system Fe-S cluster assembly regulator [Allosphingosinicella sp.]